MNTDKHFVRNLCLSVFICGLIACCQRLHAQTFPSDPRAKKAIDDAVTALGGQRFLTMEDRVESGRAYSFYRDKISGLSVATLYTQYLSTPPEKTGQELGVRERDVFGKMEEYGYTLFREKGAWEVTYKGPRDLDDERVERYRRTTLNDVLYILRVRLNEPEMTFDWKGLEGIGRGGKSARQYRGHRRFGKSRGDGVLRSVHQASGETDHGVARSQDPRQE